MREPMTCGQLLELIENVRGLPSEGYDIESAIAAIQENDMAVIEWLCRLITPQTLSSLREMGDRPMWGPGAANTSEVLR